MTGSNILSAFGFLYIAFAVIAIVAVAALVTITVRYVSKTRTADRLNRS